MNTLKEFLLFRKYVTPIALQILFWAGIGGTLYGSWWLYAHDNWAWIMALLFGTLGTRVIFEGLMLKYRTYHILQKIQESITHDN